MAVGKRRRKHQGEFWIAAEEIPESPAHPFYSKLNQLLDRIGLDDHVEMMAAPYYAEKMGRPSLPPGIYIRLLLVGYFEGIVAEHLKGRYLDGRASLLTVLGPLRCSGRRLAWSTFSPPYSLRQR